MANPIDTCVGKAKPGCLPPRTVSPTNIMFAAGSDASEPMLCAGIQHPKLLLPANQSYCSDKYALLKTGWHTIGCEFIVADPQLNRRCTKCNTAYKNIRPSRTPELYTQENKSVSAKDAIILRHDVFRKILMQRINAVGKDSALSTDSEILTIAEAMKVKGEHSLALADGTVFIVCTGDGCNRGFLKKQRENVSKLCNSCKSRRWNAPRYAARRKTNRGLRVASDSKVNFCHIDVKEVSQRAANIKHDRDLLKRVQRRLNVVSDKLEVSKGTIKHLTKAMEDLAEKRKCKKV